VRTQSVLLTTILMSIVLEPVAAMARAGGAGLGLNRGFAPSTFQRYRGLGYGWPSVGVVQSPDLITPIAVPPLERAPPVPAYTLTCQRSERDVVVPHEAGGDHHVMVVRC
jgi:hypothetical protein